VSRHAVDEAGAGVERKRLRRGQVLGFFEKLPSCLVGLEACATAHHWARKLIALGHEVRLMPPHYVKAYVKRNKNDTADAEAICEAVKRTLDALRAGKHERAAVSADNAPDP
jgi:transposase